MVNNTIVLYMRGKTLKLEYILSLLQQRKVHCNTPRQSISWYPAEICKTSFVVRIGNAYTQRTNVVC